MKYLLIDDNPIDLLVNEKIIRNCVADPEVVKMQSAADALKYLEDCTSEELPDTILLDIKMPFMDGFQFLNEFQRFHKEAFRSISIYMVSSSIDPADVERAAENDLVVDFLEKPLSQNKFLKKLNV